MTITNSQVWYTSRRLLHRMFFLLASNKAWFRNKKGIRLNYLHLQSTP